MKNPLQIIGCIILCEAVGVVGSFFTVSQIDSWYRDTLVLPSFTPPGWLFGPVWIFLYALMGVALFVLIRAKKDSARTRALVAFDTQLILNALWTPIFFGAHALFVSVIVIIALFAAIVWTMVVGYRVNKMATYLFIPYLLWVSFATVLNISIWWLNH